MLLCRLWGVFVFVFLFSFGGLCALGLPAEDKTAVCKKNHEPVYALLLRSIDSLENAYLHYRWVEFKIRLMTYQDLWTSRREAIDPVSKEARRRGEAEETRLLEILKDADQRSLAASNGFHQQIRSIQVMNADFMSCCSEKRFTECIENSFGPLYETMDMTLKAFERVFEHEREYRKEIDLTAAGRGGLYPEDALEEKSKHKPFFWRYEVPRRQARFEEDERMMRLFERAREQARTAFSGAGCCYSCGRTDWQKNTDRIISEVLSTEKSLVQ